MSVPFSPLITQPKTPDFMKKLQSILWMAAAGFLATACEIPTQYEYVRLSDAACTFLADGNIPKAIEVAASGPWSAETGASWLTVTEEAEGIVLAAADNKADSERRTEITIACGQATAHITVIQMAPEHRTNRYRILKTFDMGAVLSKNGRYAAGNVKTVRTDDVWENRPTVIDIETASKSLSPYRTRAPFFSMIPTRTDASDSTSPGMPLLRRLPPDRRPFRRYRAFRPTDASGSAGAISRATSTNPSDGLTENRRYCPYRRSISATPHM